jgi:hypothetical protein
MQRKRELRERLFGAAAAFKTVEIREKKGCNV